MSATNLITWKTSRDKYAQLEVGYLGKVAVFYVGHDGLTSKNDNCKWKLSWKLPIRCKYRDDIATSFHFESVEDAKLYADKVLQKWLEETRTKYDK